MLRRHELNVYTPQAADGTLQLITQGGKPLKLGEGRFAVVYLGSNTKFSGDSGSPALDVGSLVALKFLKRVDSESVTSNSVYRFCQEALQTAICASNGLGSVAAFFGYGRTRPLPQEGSRELQLMQEAFRLNVDGSPTRDHFLFGSHRRTAMDNRFHKEEIESLFEVPITGDFYGLELCLMSLEELLLTRGDPFQVSSGPALKSCGVVDAPFLVSAARHKAFLDQLPELKPPRDGNGFQDLDALAKWLQRRAPESQGLRQRFHDAVLFGIALMCLNATRPLHEARSVKSVDRTGTTAGPTDDVGLAHRDLKPANVLLSMNPDTMKLSDLGFVASVGDIRVGSYTVFASMDEGGVLPLGSKGFRSPEQIESGEDFRFKPMLRKEADSLQSRQFDGKDEVRLEAARDATGALSADGLRLPDAAKAASSIGTQIAVFANLDTEIEVGDFLKLDGSYSDGTRLARVRSVPGNVNEQIYGLTKQPASHDDQKGRLIKDVSLHSDIYSIGCMAYYLGSEGQNPERFMRFFLDRIAIERLGATLPSWVLESPLWLSALLCQAEGDAIISDLGAHARSRPQTTHKADPHYDKHATEVERALGRVRPLLDREAAKLHEFRQGIRANAATRQLLFGRVSEIPISFPLLYLTLLCCARTGQFAVVSRDPQVFDEKNAYRAVYSRNAHSFARTIGENVLVLAQSKSLQGEWAPLAPLGANPPDPAKMFIHARLAWRMSKDFDSVPTADQKMDISSRPT